MQRSVRSGPDGWTGPHGRGAPGYDWDQADPATDHQPYGEPDYGWDPAGPAAGFEPYGAPGYEDYNAEPDYDWGPAGPVNDPRLRGPYDHAAEDYAEPDYDWGPAGPVNDLRLRGSHDYAEPDYDWGPAGPVNDLRLRGPHDYAEPDYAAHEYAAPDYAAHEYTAPDYAAHQYAEPDYAAHEYTAPDYAAHEYAEPGPAGRPAGPAGDPRRRGGRRRRRPRRRRYPPLRQRMWVRVTAGLLATFLVVVAWSVGNALTVPGGGTVSARLAEWARDHYLGPVVTFGEWLTYRAPKTGGRPSFALTAPGAAPASPGKSRGQTAASFGPPAPLPSLAGKPLPGEGQWRVLSTVHGTPAVYGTYLRASSVFTSYVAGIASLNQRLVRFELRPGSEDPGPGNWKTPPDIPPGTRTGLLATFNSGFKIAQSDGGFYLNGSTKGTLAKGVASVVYYRDGHISIGVWGQTVRMTPDVVGVRQNLHLVVDNGRIPGSVDSNVKSSWGATLGGGYYVWRSGIGITRGGRVIFVYGPALNVRELAELLKRAGAVTAMQLDINPEWMSYMYYLPKHHPADPTPVVLLPNQMQAANRYYSVTGRDFTAVYAR